MTRLAVIGNISVDTAVYPDSRRTTLGGAALHIALAATRTGLATAPVSVIGTDLDHLRTDRRFDAIDWSGTVTRPRRSASFTLTYNAQGDLAELEADYGVAATLTEHALTHIRARHDDTYHVCCRRPLDIAVVLDALSRNGQPFSVDFMVSSAQQSIAAAAPLIHRADAVFVNTTEYGLLTAAVPARLLSRVIVTDGPRLVRLYREGRLDASVTPTSSTAIELTGAGDTLTGTFLAARASGQPESTALQWAVMAATHHTTTPGLTIDAP